MNLNPDHRRPVFDLEDLATLDSNEVMEGYRDGMDNWPCGENRSRSYWHGWRNGRVDFKHAESDWAQMMLAKAAVSAARRGSGPLSHARREVRNPVLGAHPS